LALFQFHFKCANRTLVVNMYLTDLVIVIVIIAYVGDGDLYNFLAHPPHRKLRVVLVCIYFKRRLSSKLTILQAKLTNCRVADDVYMF